MHREERQVALSTVRVGRHGVLVIEPPGDLVASFPYRLHDSHLEDGIVERRPNDFARMGMGDAVDYLSDLPALACEDNVLGLVEDGLDGVRQLVGAFASNSRTQSRNSSRRLSAMLSVPVQITVPPRTQGVG
jgi:hypothetical protein